MPLTPDEQRILNDLEAEEAAKSDLADVQTGPGVPEEPYGRVMTGAVDPTEASQQATDAAGADNSKPINEKGKNI